MTPANMPLPKDYYRFSGEIVNRTVFGERRTPAAGVVCITFRTAVPLEETALSGTEISVENVLTDDGAFYRTAHLIASEFKSATDTDVSVYTETLAERNLEIAERIERRKSLIDGTPRVERFNGLGFIDPAAVRYRVNAAGVRKNMHDKVLTCDEAKRMALPDGAVFMLRYDNVFTYWGNVTTTRVRFFELADRLLRSPRFTESLRGIELTRSNPQGEYMVQVNIGKADERFAADVDRR